MSNALVGKVGSVFTSTASQHGGQETTITSVHATLLHHGMIIVGLPYSAKGLLTMEEITGVRPMGLPRSPEAMDRVCPALMSWNLRASRGTTWRKLRTG